MTVILSKRFFGLNFAKRVLTSLVLLSIITLLSSLCSRSILTKASIQVAFNCNSYGNAAMAELDLFSALQYFLMLFTKRFINNQI